MSKERGGSAAVASMSSSIGGSRGGVGLAERSASKGFSSRGLASFNAPERSAISSIRTTGPSLSTGRGERSGLSLGRADKPSLSLKGTSFESTKSTAGKTRGNTFANATENFRSSVKTNSPKASSERRANGIEIRSVISQPKSFDKMPAFVPVLKAEPKGLVTQKNLDASVPAKQFTSEVPKVSQNGLVTQRNFEERNTRPATQITRALDVPKGVVRDYSVIQPKQEASKIAIVPKTSPIDIVEKQAPARVEVKTNNLATLAIWAQHSERDKKKKHERENIMQEQIEYTAHAYVRAGVARDVGDGVRMVERFLRIEPTVLAKNQLQVEALKYPAKDVTQKPARVEPLPATLPLYGVKSETNIREAQSTKATAEVIVYAKAGSVPEQKMQPIIPTNNNNNNGAEKRVGVTYDEVEQPKISEPQPKVSFKVDEAAQRNREFEWLDAIRRVFPAFDYTAEAPLSKIASLLKPPSRDTNSTLIYQVGKKVDGSNESDEDWRTPLLTSKAIVTAALAKITGLYEIYTKPPVIMKSFGRSVTRKDVDLVLSGEETKDNYALAA